MTLVSVAKRRWAGKGRGAAPLTDPLAPPQTPAVGYGRIRDTGCAGYSLNGQKGAANAEGFWGWLFMDSFTIVTEI